MDAVVGECVAVAGTLAGAAVGVAGAANISRRAREDAFSDRMRDAFGDYLGALYTAVADLRELPDVERIPMLDQAVSRLRGEKAAFIATRRREQQVFGDAMRNRAHALGLALAGLQILPLPSSVRDAVDEANDYVERLAARRTDDIKEEWSEVHEKLMVAAELLRTQKQSGHGRRLRLRAVPAASSRLRDGQGSVT